MTDTLLTADAAARPSSIVVSGDGSIADAVRAELARCTPQLTEAVIVHAADGWTDAPDRAVLASVAAGQAAIAVHTEPGQVLIGPYTRPERPGCPRCVDLRRDRADVDAPARAAARAALPDWQSRPAGLLTRSAATAVATLTLDEILAAQRGTEPRLLTVNLGTLDVALHRFLPEPLCPACGQLPLDRPEEVLRDAGRPQPKRGPDDYRIRDLDPDRLAELYVDDQTGLIREIKRGVQGGLIVAGAILPLRHDRVTEPGVGRSDRYGASRRIAVLEALERYGGVQPGGRRTAVTARFADLDHALDLRALGVHDAADYHRPGFGFRPFDEDQMCRWVWGWSYRADAPIMVPETLGYYRHDFDGDPIDRPFVYDNSNGCALGGSPEEAVLHGLLEVLERDAFLLTWYTRRPAVPIDLANADREIRQHAAAVEASTGYRVAAFDITTETGIPCVWALATAPGPYTAGGDPLPALVCAAGSHPDPRQAVRNALNEVGPLLQDLIRRFPSEADRAEQMVDDHDLVRGMLDHSTLYGSVRAAARLGFLTGPSDDHRDHRRVDQVGAGGFRHTDLRDDLAEAVGRVIACGSDVIVVDQTTPEHRAAGLSCVKVLVPGALAMTFGHRFRRTAGIDRLLTAPQTLGYGRRSLTAGELNLAPHPFP